MLERLWNRALQAAHRGFSDTRSEGAAKVDFPYRPRSADYSRTRCTDKTRHTPMGYPTCNEPTACAETTEQNRYRAAYDRHYMGQHRATYALHFATKMFAINATG